MISRCWCPSLISTMIIIVFECDIMIVSLHLVDQEIQDCESQKYVAVILLRPCTCNGFSIDVVYKVLLQNGYSCSKPKSFNTQLQNVYLSLKYYWHA